MIKYLIVYEEIKKRIDNGEYPFGSNIPTEKELIDIFKVSRIVIRMAVDKLVKQGYLCRKAGYGTTVCVDNNKKENNKVIGVLFTFIASSFGAAILLAIEREARLLGYNILFKNSNNTTECEKQCLKELYDFGVKGVIMQPIHNEKYNPSLEPFINKKIPIVLIDRDYEKMDLSFVGTDSILETRNAVKKLFMFGHTRLGLVSQNITSATSLSERVKGFNLAHENAGIPFSSSQIMSNIISISDYSPTNYDCDKRKIKAFLAENDFNCILATELSVSQIVSDVISENDEFKKIALATFDRSETPLKYGKYYILQNQNEIGEKAVAMLYSQILSAPKCVKQFVATEFVAF